MKIIYQEVDGSVSVMTPAPNCPLSDMETALKDVPTGLKFKIVEDTYIPTDHTFRNAWAIDESQLTDGVGD
tara:strand:+ start:1033 stop:1245 length:213 start_codon:yes stop_codon:yes gene_type:complete